MVDKKLVSELELFKRLISNTYRTNIFATKFEMPGKIVQDLFDGNSLHNLAIKSIKLGNVSLNENVIGYFARKYPFPGQVDFDTLEITYYDIDISDKKRTQGDFENLSSTFHFWKNNIVDKTRFMWFDDISTDIIIDLISNAFLSSAGDPARGFNFSTDVVGWGTRPTGAYAINPSEEDVYAVWDSYLDKTNESFSSMALKNLAYTISPVTNPYVWFKILVASIYEAYLLGKTVNNWGSASDGNISRGADLSSLNNDKLGNYIADNSGVQSEIDSYNSEYFNAPFDKSQVEVDVQKFIKSNESPSKWPIESSEFLNSRLAPDDIKSINQGLQQLVDKNLFVDQPLMQKMLQMLVQITSNGSPSNMRVGDYLNKVGEESIVASDWNNDENWNQLKKALTSLDNRNIIEDLQSFLQLNDWSSILDILNKTKLKLMVPSFKENKSHYEDVKNALNALDNIQDKVKKLLNSENKEAYSNYKSKISKTYGKYKAGFGKGADSTETSIAHEFSPLNFDKGLLSGLNVSDKAGDAILYSIEQAMVITNTIPFMIGVSQAVKKNINMFSSAAGGLGVDSMINTNIGGTLGKLTGLIGDLGAANTIVSTPTLLHAFLTKFLIPLYLNKKGNIGLNSGEITEFVNGFELDKLKAVDIFNDINSVEFKETVYNVFTKDSKFRINFTKCYPTAITLPTLSGDAGGAETIPTFTVTYKFHDMIFNEVLNGEE